MVWAADERTRALKVLQKYPGRAMVVMYHDGRAETPLLKRTKFVCPSELSVAQLMVILRKNVHLDSSQALFVFYQNLLLPGNTTLAQARASHGDLDGILHLTYSCESSFGGVANLQSRPTTSHRL